MKNKFAFFALFALSAACAALSVMLASCAKKPQEAAVQPSPATVYVAKPLVMDVELKRSYSAKAVANKDVEVRARVGGYLKCASFDAGSRVEAGETLFRIDDRPYTLALKAAMANVEAARARVGLAELNAQRGRALFKRNAISEEAFQMRETELAVAKAKLSEALSSENNARLNLNYTRVEAPFSGRVAESFVDDGNLINAHTTPLTRVIDDSVMKVYFELNTADALRYKNSGLLAAIDSGKGAEAEFTANGEASAHKGKLCYYSNALGKGTGSLLVRADISNADAAIIPESFGTITVREGVLMDALLLPEEAIGTDLAGRFVFVVDENGIVRAAKVEVGFAVGKLRVVSGSIDKNSRVVVRGIQRASAGRKVSAREEQIKTAVPAKPYKSDK